MNDWIKVKDRLPEFYKTVEVKLASGLEVYGFRFPSGEWSHNFSVEYWR